MVTQPRNITSTVPSDTSFSKHELSNNAFKPSKPAMKLSAILQALKLNRKRENSPPYLISPVHSPLEALPIELRILIISFTSDITTLHNLVRSSPTYHAAYLASRHLIITNTLLTTLHPSILLDALAINQASLLPHDATRADCYRIFEISYKLDRSQAGQNNEKYLFGLNGDAVLTIARMHSIILRSVQKYFKSIQPDTRIPLSEVEKLRIMRGFYRFQLFVELFGDAKDDMSVVGIRTMNRAYGRTFLTDYLPWEGEEVACIAVFLAAFYTKHLESCAEEIRAWDLEHPSDVIRDEATAERWIRIRAETQLEVLLKQGLPFYHSLPSEAKNSWPLLQPHIVPANITTSSFINHSLRNDPYFGHIAGANQIVDERRTSNWGWKDRQDTGSDRKWGYVFWDSTRKGCFDDSKETGELDEWKIWDVGALKEEQVVEGNGKQATRGVRWWEFMLGEKAMGSRAMD